MNKISVLFLVKNEEKRIRKAIESVLPFADEVVVIDDESTDRTREICQELGAKVFMRPLNRDFGAQCNFGVEKCSYDWVFIMDADEIVPEETIDWVMHQVKNSDFLDAEVIYMRRLNHIWGRPIYHGGSSIWLPRLFKRGSLKFVGKVHPGFEINTRRVLYAPPFIYHFPLESISKMVSKINFYTDLQVEEGVYSHLSEKQLRNRLLLRPMKLFWKHYIRKSGYKDGVLGLVWIVMNNILNEVILYLKLLEKKQESNPGFSN